MSYTLKILIPLLYLSQLISMDQIRDYSHSDLVKLLKENPDMVKAVDYNGESLLHVAAQKGNVENVKLLVASKADVNQEGSGYSGTPLITALRYLSPSMLPGNRGVNNKKLVDIVEILLNAGANTEPGGRYEIDDILCSYGYRNFHLLEIAIETLLNKRKSDQ